MANQINSKKSTYSLHTKISEDYRAIIKNLALKYGSIQKVIEEAIDLVQVKNTMYDRFKSSQIQRSTMDEYRLSHLMLNDFNMMAVGRRTFLSFISTIPEEPINENNALELIEWFYDHKFQIGELSLYKILNSIKKLWIAANYFTNCQIKALDGNELHSSQDLKVVFTHDFNESNYGHYWSKYFTQVLTSPPNSFIIYDLVVRNQSFYFSIKKTFFDKKNLQGNDSK